MSNKKKNKYYIKAIKYFDIGEFEKALKMCEEGIAENLKNSATLNLKGLLLYLKGDLKGAVATWKINSDFNDDDMAKAYISDSKKDKEKIGFFKEGEVFLARLMLDKAIEKFKSCTESDFNSIKVNTCLAICYIKKGEYPIASAHVSKALSIDKNYVQAIHLAKELEEFSGVKLEIRKKDYSKQILIALVLTALIAIGAFSGVSLISQKNSDTFEVTQNSENQEQTSDNIDEQKNEDKIVEESTKTVNEATKTGETNKEPVVTINDISVALANENYDDLYTKIKIINKDSLNDKEKTIYLKAEEVLSEGGVKAFYQKGFSFYKNKDYVKASEYFKKGYEYGKKSYLYPDIVFFSAALADKTKNNSEAIKLYTDYYTNYKNGDYFEETLYNLAMLYKDIDVSKSLIYANELKYDHPGSIYNNENISKLLGLNS